MLFILTVLYYQNLLVYFNFNIDNCYARILQIVTYSISVWILLEDKNKLQLQLVHYGYFHYATPFLHLIE